MSRKMEVGVFVESLFENKLFLNVDKTKAANAYLKLTLIESELCDAGKLTS